MMNLHMRVHFPAFFLVAWILIIACPALGQDEPENLAFERPVTGSGGVGQGAYELVTDGNTDSDPYLGGPSWVQVELEDEFLIDTIKIWHYYADGRTYHGNKIALSKMDTFLGEEVVVFDTDDADEEYPETPEGKTITFDPVEAVFIRAWVNGNSVNEWAHWVELQAFFIGSQPVEPLEKLPITWGKIKWISDF